jgi:hypothetical protein
VKKDRDPPHNEPILSSATSPEPSVVIVCARLNLSHEATARTLLEGDGGREGR